MNTMKLNSSTKGISRFLNQARVGLWPVRNWFLKIDPVQIIGIRVYVYAQGY